MTDDDITITAERAKVMASEKVSVADYENAQTSLTLEVSIEGAELEDGLPEEVRDRLYAIQRQVQAQTKAAAEERKVKGGVMGPERERVRD
jgi:hypothetical protein